MEPSNFRQKYKTLKVLSTIHYIIKIDPCFWFHMIKQFKLFLIESLNSQVTLEEVDVHCSEHKHPKLDSARKFQSFVMGHSTFCFMALNERFEALTWFDIF